MPIREGELLDASYFLSRVLRCVGIICLASGVLDVAQSIGRYVAYPVFMTAMRYTVPSTSMESSRFAKNSAPDSSPKRQMGSISVRWSYVQPTRS